MTYVAKKQKAPAIGPGLSPFSAPSGPDTHMTPGHLSAMRLLRQGLEFPRKFPAHLGLTNETLDHLLSLVEQDLQYGVVFPESQTRRCVAR